MSLWGGGMYLWQKNWRNLWLTDMELLLASGWDLWQYLSWSCLSWAGGDVTWMRRRVTWRWGRGGKPHASTQSTFCLDNPYDHHPLIKLSWSPGHHPLLSLPASKCSQSYGSQPQQLSLMLLSAGYYRRLAPRSWSTLRADRAAANTRRPASPPFPSLAGCTTQDLTTQEFSHCPPKLPSTIDAVVEILNKGKRHKICHWKIGLHKYINTTLDPAQMEIEREEEEFSHWPPKLPTASASAPWRSRATNSLRTRKCYKCKDLHNFLKVKKQVQIHPFPIRKLVEDWILANKSYPDKSTSTTATIHNVFKKTKRKKIKA